MAKRDKPKTQDQINTSASNLEKALALEIKGEYGILDKPGIIAGLIELDEPFTGGNNGLLGSVLDNFMGASVARMLPQYEQVFDALKKSGLGVKHAMDLGYDSKLFALCERQVASTTPNFDDALDAMLGIAPGTVPHGKKNDNDIAVKAMGLTTQNGNFLFVLNEQYGETTMHIREYWPSLDEALAQDQALGFGLRNIAAIKDATNLTVKDAVRWASLAATYADDFPDNPYPARPSLQTFLDSTLVEKDHKKGLNLGWTHAGRNGPGYVLSTINRSDTVTEAQNMLDAGVIKARYAINWLDNAVRRLPETMPQP